MTAPIQPADYIASPPTTDPVKLLREREIAIRYLKSEIDCLEGELVDRANYISELTQELADTR